MSGEYEPREHDHLIEPMIHAVHGEARGATEQPGEEREISRVVAWSPLLVPFGGFAVAVTVWALYRLFS